MFLCIDGLDGSGKTTTAEALREKLTMHSAVAGCKVRHLPTRPYEELSQYATTPPALAFTYIADMAEAIREDLDFIADPQKWIIWDRGIFSTMVYQIPAMGITNYCEQERTARALHESFMLAVKSAFRLGGKDVSRFSECVSRYVLLDAPLGLCLSRVAERKSSDLYENADREVWARRAQDYWRYFNLFGKQIVRVEGRTVGSIADEIFKNLRLYTRGM